MFVRNNAQLNLEKESNNANETRKDVVAGMVAGGGDHLTVARIGSPLAADRTTRRSRRIAVQAPGRAVG
jgi:hypothetical protein